MAPKLNECQLCKNIGEVFTVPVGDPVSVELMNAHLIEKHKITYPVTIRRKL